MKNFTIYREGNYDYKANAAIKAEQIAQVAGRITITGLKLTARTLLNASELAIKGQTLSRDNFTELGL